MNNSTVLINDKYILESEVEQYKELLQEFSETKDFFKRLELDKTIKGFEERGKEAKQNEPIFYETIGLYDGASEEEIMNKYKELSSLYYEESLRNELGKERLDKLNKEFMQISKKDKYYKQGFIDGRMLDLEINKKKSEEIDPKEDPIKEDPIKEDPAKEEPKKEDPIKEDPTKEEPKKEDPIKEDPQRHGIPLPGLPHHVVPKGQEIIVRPSAEIVPTEEPIEVVEQQHKPNFFEKHKKAIIIAAGLAAAAALAGPVLIPSLMYANSAMWLALPNFPALQGILHAINLNVLGPLINATYASSGVWTAASGVAINNSMAAGVLLGHALNLSAIPVIGIKVSKWLDKRKAKKIEKEKEKKEKGNNPTPPKQPGPTPVPPKQPTPMPQEPTKANYYDILGIPNEERVSISLERLKEYFVIKATEVRETKSENSEDFRLIVEAYKTLKDPVRKQAYDEYINLQAQNTESNGKHM